MKNKNDLGHFRQGVVRTSFLVLGCFCLIPSKAMSANAGHVPLIFSIDSDYKYDNPQTGVIGALIDSSGNKRTSKQGQNLKAALNFDLAAAALPAVTCGILDAEADDACATIPLVDPSNEGLKAILSQHGGAARWVRYFAMHDDERFWARLIIQEVTLEKDEVLIEKPRSAYYLSRLTNGEIKLNGEPWKNGTPSRLEVEVRDSWLELRNMWLRIEADSAAGADPRDAWKKASKVPKNQDGWTFRCRGMFGCLGQNILSLTESRVWITSGGGPGLMSLNKAQAAFGSNTAAVVFQ